MQKLFKMSRGKTKTTVISIQKSDRQRVGPFHSPYPLPLLVSCRYLHPSPFPFPQTIYDVCERCKIFKHCKLLWCFVARFSDYRISSISLEWK